MKLRKILFTMACTCMLIFVPTVAAYAEDEPDTNNDAVQETITAEDAEGQEIKAKETLEEQEILTVAAEEESDQTLNVAEIQNTESAVYAYESSAMSVGRGFCGDSLEWSLDSAGTLTISGKGRMYDYSGYNSVPWYDNRSSINKIIVQSGVTYIGDGAFAACNNLTSAIIPNGVTAIGSSAYSGCSSLIYVTIPNSVTSIGNFAFYGCSSLVNVTIPNSVTSIGSFAFRGCSSLVNVTIPSGVTTIGDSAFYGCSSLVNVTIPSGVTTIGDSAFYGCNRLTSVTIPASVKTIRWRAFAFTGLKSVIYKGSKPVSNDAFQGVMANAYYPDTATDNAIIGDKSWSNIESEKSYGGGTFTWKSWYTLGNDPTCNHVFSNKKVPVSCTWGYTLHQCSCGYSYRTDFVAGSHNLVIDKAVDATCEKAGLTEGLHCTKCDYKVEQAVVPATGHTEQTIWGYSPTYTSTGLTNGLKCSVCGKILKKQEVIPENGWHTINGKTYYYEYGEILKGYWINENDSGYKYFTDWNTGVRVEGFKKIDSYWYYFNPGTGRMATGFKKVNGYWYCFDSDGTMCTGLWKIGTGYYYFRGGDSGIMLTGWQKINGNWYYFKGGNSGRAYTGFNKINGSWYYFNTTGKMCTGLWKIGTGYYYFRGGDSGRMLTGWQKINGNWYYFKGGDSGRAYTGFNKINGSWYFFNSNGTMGTGLYRIGSDFYYFNYSSGKMMTGWQKIGGYWYYFKGGDSGRALTGTQKINGRYYYFNQYGRLYS